ncbi:MAG TPA: CDP-alcohol phosphatidyltransferase family protein [Vicinamibacterales bacterium]|jgi:cardiolipin synthase|nr:CDP-alcohol phosphatidyltransferase family protein [Vicinamibacterales bacterium]
MSLTLANQLTLMRLALVPAFVILVLYGRLGWALAAFVTAGITDGLDGLIARWTNSRTALGAFLDPMADKLLLVSAFVVLSLPGIGLVNRIPVWLTVLVISRDVAIVVTVAIVSLTLGPRTFPPSVYGKVATALYIVTIAVVLLFNFLGQPSVVVDIMVWVSLAITLLSGFHYTVHLRRTLNEPPVSP